jgi:hypothetical protein
MADQFSLASAGSESSAAAEKAPVANLDRYDQEQQGYWEQLRQELEQYKADLGATNTELAQCLGISRQPLVQFMQNSSSGLPIQRSHLLRLWAGLTDVDRFRKKHSDEQRARRDHLRRQGPNRLLQAAGFLPQTPEPSLDIRPTRYQQIQRIATRLSNLPVRDFADFISLTDFLETVVTNSFPDKYKVSLDAEVWAKLVSRGAGDLGGGARTGGVAGVPKAVSDRVDEWVSQNQLPSAPSASVRAKLQGALSRLAISGKAELNNAEFFELYMAIAENERLSSHIDRVLQMRVTQCQFTTLTTPLHDYLTADTRQLAAELEQASLQAEQHLRPRLQTEDDLQDAVAEPVIEASIICNFRACNEDVRWAYSSSTTHFENMLTAIERGLGYGTALEMVDFSIRTLGHQDYSLIRASTAFRTAGQGTEQGDYKTYQSVWVDRSAILSILQSTVIAVRAWLAEKFPDEQSCRDYYNVCSTIAAIDDVITKGKKLLNGYRIQQTEQHQSRSTTEYLESQAIEKITALKSGLLKHNPNLAACYEEILDQKYCTAKLTCAHSAMVEGNMATADRLLNEVEEFLQTFGMANHPLHVACDLERKIFQFYRGDGAIFAARGVWRSQLQSAIQHLSQYIAETWQRQGRFDADIYMTASEIWGRVGRLNLVCCDATEGQELREAVRQLLQAAYCSAKAGQPQRAAHWINNASRACCRLGEGDRAMALANLADHIIDRAIQLPHSAEYREAILAEVNIAQGERLLLIDRNGPEALDCFLRSLRGAIYIGFVRLIADNLYNIARAAQNLGNYRIRKSLALAFLELDGKATDPHWWMLKEATQGWQENKIAAEVIQFFNAIDVNADWSSVAPLFQAEAQRIWRDWPNVATHPIADAIATGQYLDRVQ